jgi:hypothetical protein
MKIHAPLIIYFFVAGCSGTTANAPPASPSTTASSPAPAREASAKPDRALAVKHLREHIKYPASRAGVLAACADTPEFSGEEKKWLTENLPDRTYGSADEVAVALHL